MANVTKELMLSVVILSCLCLHSFIGLVAILPDTAGLKHLYLDAAAQGPEPTEDWPPALAAKEVVQVKNSPSSCPRGGFRPLPPNGLQLSEADVLIHR